MSYTRNEKDLISLRPALGLSVDQSSEEELFQNEVIRPIIKMQHDVIISLIQEFPHFKNVLKNRENYQVFREHLSTYLNKNHSTKNQLIGMVIGMMTVDEMAQYINNVQSLNKRIVNMIAKRVADTLHKEVPTF